MDRCIATVHREALRGSGTHKLQVAVMEPVVDVTPDLMDFRRKEETEESTLVNEQSELITISGCLTISF